MPISIGPAYRRHGEAKTTRQLALSFVRKCGVNLPTAALIMGDSRQEDYDMEWDATKVTKKLGRKEKKKKKGACLLGPFAPAMCGIPAFCIIPAGPGPGIMFGAPG